MPFTLTMPKLSPTMTDGTIAKWHKKEGDYVEAGDLLLEVSTDKATVEHNALDAGWLKKILIQEGAKAAVNEPLAVFTEEEKESIEGYTPEGITPTAVTPTTKVAPIMKQPVAAAPSKPKATPAIKTAPIATSKKAAPTTKERVLASPLAKNLATQRGIDLRHIKGSGPNGRVMSRDLEQYEQVKSTVTPTTTLSEEVEEIPLTPMRQAIAMRLQLSKSTIPHFYLHQEVDAEKLIAMREETKKLELNYTVNDFIIKAVATALAKHPMINVGFNPDSNAMIVYPTIDIAVAVTIANGLITPIVKNASSKALATISKEVKSLANRAKEGKLLPEEFMGGSFTISNLGMYGISDFQAIINPPQGAILAVGAVLDKPVVKDGQVVPGKVLNITLSCDHRVIDGAEGAAFMKSLKAILENPMLFLAE